jgi:hypothetical protein
MKIGDLIKMSAAGRKTDQNSKCVGGWGIITEIHPERFGYTGRNYPYVVTWFLNGESFPFRFSRYEIKKLKAVKK